MEPIDKKDVNFGCFYKTPLGEMVRIELKEEPIELKDDTETESKITEKYIKLLQMHITLLGKEQIPAIIKPPAIIMREKPENFYSSPDAKDYLSVMEQYLMQLEKMKAIQKRLNDFVYILKEFENIQKG